VRAHAAQLKGDWAEAERCYRETIEQFPDAHPAHHNLVTVLNAQFRWADAEEALRTALRRWPDHPILRLNLGYARLAAGDYAEGLPHYELRREAARDRVHVPAMPFPEWDGSAVRSLLLLPEQGLGDQIQFSRYVPLLHARGIAVTLVCHPSLLHLFEPLGVTVVAATASTKIEAHDAWALIGSLPLRFSTRLETIPPPTPIRATARTKSGIGVAVRGNPLHHNDRNRSLPAAAADRMLQLEGATSLLPEDTGARNFQETAELVAGLDLVISVDTSIAHLAASMGKPTWILLPKVKCDWRWGAVGERSHWYPCARLFRQTKPGDWDQPIQDILTALQRERGARAPTR
jgi:hypothetical protein